MQIAHAHNKTVHENINIFAHLHRGTVKVIVLKGKNKNKIRNERKVQWNKYHSIFGANKKERHVQRNKSHSIFGVTYHYRHSGVNFSEKICGTWNEKHLYVDSVWIQTWCWYCCYLGSIGKTLIRKDATPWVPKTVSPILVFDRWTWADAIHKSIKQHS